MWFVVMDAGSTPFNQITWKFLLISSKITSKHHHAPVVNVYNSMEILPDWTEANQLPLVFIPLPPTELWWNYQATHCVGNISWMCWLSSGMFTRWLRKGRTIWLSLPWCSFCNCSGNSRGVITNHVVWLIGRCCKQNWYIWKSFQWWWRQGDYSWRLICHYGVSGDTFKRKKKKVLEVRKQ